MFNVIAAIAQFEREVMLARQREGIAKAKSKGKYKGRAPTAQAKSGEVLSLPASKRRPRNRRCTAARHRAALGLPHHRGCERVSVKPVVARPQQRDSVHRLS